MNFAHQAHTNKFNKCLLSMISFNSTFNILNKNAQRTIYASFASGRRFGVRERAQFQFSIQYLKPKNSTTN